MISYIISTFLIIYSLHLFECKDECSKTICNPKAGDLLIGRESFLTASSTCGLSQMDKYCVVTPSDSGRKSKCNFCYSKDPYQKFSSSISHRIENVVSRLPQDPNRWWQSENGAHNVSIEISFESEFQFTFTHLRFKTYRPAAMYIERSKDYGRTWEKYAYFSENCARDFPNIPERKRNNINEVLCSSEFSSIIPSEGGTVLFSADTSDWHNEVFWNKERNDITAITNLRVQFVRLHTFGDLKIDSNPNIRNKYYYAISEWIIRGRCSCYGHASRCKPKEGQIQIKEMVFGVCECEHNTKGQHCEKCADFYNDSPWLPADKKSTNACRKCDCNRHATNCYFNPMVYVQSGNKSGGVCENCQHNTESKNCERCKNGYYRNNLVQITSPETCLKCQCNSHGTAFSQLCIQENEPDRNLIAGSCICKENVDGIYCDKCKTGFWKFNANDEKGCTECKCLMIGTVNNEGCDSMNGNCYCKAYVMKEDCSTCKDGYFNISASNPDGCSPCKCSEYGSIEPRSCDKFSGQCKCKNGYTGKGCSEIKPEWYVKKPVYPLKYKDWIKIELPPVAKSGYYNFIITMDTSQIQIHDSVVIALGISHEKPSPCQDYQDTMILTHDSKYIVVPNKCLEKDLSITISVFTVEQSSINFMPPAIIHIIVVPMLDVNSTKTRNVLADCLKYKQVELPKHCHFLNTEISTKDMSKADPQKCNCNVTGSVNNVCNKYGGQCQCLPNVGGKNCDQCIRNSYGFDARGCKKCDCDPNGSLDLQCSSDTGKCLCRTGVEGSRCDSCKSGYWNYPFCEACKCNGMADMCDQKTGKCINCRGNSFGFYCQQCHNGYYGNPNIGKPCSKCECPGINNRNNSIGCNLIFNTTTYYCLCKPGYKGRFCDSCEDNYFGNPQSKDGVCIPCKCSANIDSNIPDSCDSRTGECKKCLYNTAGFNCEKCASGYFGNGVARTCKKCVCNKLGTDSKYTNFCNQETGQCSCLPNVSGQQCDQCQDNFYNISSKAGCSPCQCDSPIGAVSTLCNKLTGQCYCHSGRSGLKCDSCEDGYWGDPRISNGCKLCICNSEGSLFKQCDRYNGACRCNPGITGRYCDECMKGTDGKMPNCTSCGSCWLEWDNIIGRIENSVYAIHNESSIVERIQFPKEINIIFNSIYNYLNLSKSMMSFYPAEFEITVRGMELKLTQIKNIFVRLKMTNFDSNNYSTDGITSRINLIKQQVAKNKIRDAEGANNEITKSLHLVSNAVFESNNLLNKIISKRKTLLRQNEDLKYIDIDVLDRKNKELNDLLSLMLNNLKTFNGVTCNLNIVNNSLKCSEFCGGEDCVPEKCYRNNPINSQCMMTTSPLFFNGFAWKIQNKKKLELDLEKLVYYLNIFNSTNIKGAHIKPEEDYNAIVKLIGITNFTVRSTHDNAKELLNRIKKYINESANKNDFKVLLDKIWKFDLSFDKEEIKELEDEISKRKEKLTNVDSILEKSKDNRMDCEILKKTAIQAKKNATSLLQSITNITTNYKTIGIYKVQSKELLSNFSINLEEAEHKLKSITKNQNETVARQKNISAYIDQIILTDSKIKKSLSDLSGNLSALVDDQGQSLRQLNTVKDGIAIASKKKNDILKNHEISENKLSQDVQMLIKRVQDLMTKTQDNRKKLAFDKQVIAEKQSALQNLELEIDSKLNRIANLQESIYSKSEFHAECLP